jgi:hypothetical protein
MISDISTSAFNRGGDAGRYALFSVVLGREKFGMSTLARKARLLALRIRINRGLTAAWRLRRSVVDVLVAPPRRDELVAGPLRLPYQAPPGRFGTFATFPRVRDEFELASLLSTSLSPSARRAGPPRRTADVKGTYSMLAESLSCDGDGGGGELRVEGPTSTESDDDDIFKSSSSNSPPWKCTDRAGKSAIELT